MYWQENLVERDMPPRWMWALDDEINRHFDKVKAKRDGNDHDDDDDSPPAGPMLVNEYARERRRNAR